MRLYKCGSVEIISCLFIDAGESYLLSLLSFPFICSNYHHR